MLMTSAIGTTHIYENGERVWPCRCGKTHRGAYAQEDWAMHQCLHQADLMVSELSDGNYQVLCPDCGASWKGSRLPL